MGGWTPTPNCWTIGFQLANMMIASCETSDGTTLELPSSGFPFLVYFGKRQGLKCILQMQCANPIKSRVGRQTWEGVGEWEGHSLMLVFANHSSNVWGFFCSVSILEWCCCKMWSGTATEGAGQRLVRQFDNTGPCCRRDAFRMIFFRRAY